MADIKSNYNSPLGLPSGQTITPGATIAVEKWKHNKDHAVVKAWLAAGVIEVVGGTDEDTQTEDDDAVEDARKDELISQLAALGVEKNKRFSVASLEEALKEAQDAAGTTDPDINPDENADTNAEGGEGDGDSSTDEDTQTQGDE